MKYFYICVAEFYEDLYLVREPNVKFYSVDGLNYKTYLGMVKEDGSLIELKPLQWQDKLKGVPA